MYSYSRGRMVLLGLVRNIKGSRGLNFPLSHVTILASNSKESNNLTISRTYAHGVSKKIDRYAKYTKLWNIPDPQTDPLDVINQSIDVPIVPPEDMLFSPGRDEINESTEIFKTAVRGNQIQALKGIVDLNDLPDSSMPEIAFLGRSNVGKSSLINSIFYRNPQLKVRVSKKPGFTRILKFFNVGKLFTLVDMPGYGHNMPEYFVESMETYLRTRRQINRIFLLIDGDVGLQSTDEIALNMVEEFAKPYTIILTKIDKNAPSTVLRNVHLVRQRISNSPNCFPQPFLVSSKQDWGIPLLQSYITYITSAQNFKNI